LTEDRKILERRKMDRIFYIRRYRERRRKKDAKKKERN
jgi:hypothetical protein